MYPNKYFGEFRLFKYNKNVCINTFTRIFNKADKYI